MYDGDGYYLNTVPMINVSLRTGWLPLDYNMEKFTQGSFRQFSGAYDHIIDFDVRTIKAENLLFKYLHTGVQNILSL